MIKLRKYKLALAVLMFVLVNSLSFAGSEYVLDKAHSSVSFTISHMVVSKVRGHFNDFDVKLTYDEKDIALTEHLSIKKASKVLNGNKDKKDENGLEPEKKNKSDFSQADLDGVWKSNIPAICKRSPNLLSSLMTKNPLLGEDYRIVVTADNKVLEREIKVLLPEILGVLKNKLNKTLKTFPP